MSHEDVPGWVDGHLTAEYDRAIFEAPAPPTVSMFVEVGVAFGKSLVYAANRVRESGKRILLFGVDPWEESWNQDSELAALMAKHGSFHEACIAMLAEHAPGAYGPIVSLLKKRSVDAAEHFKRYAMGIDFVFVDGLHDYESVKADIAAWRDLVKPGGVMAGHDHTGSYPGVERACVEAFGAGGYVANGSCWRWRKPA